MHKNSYKFILSLVQNAGGGMFIYMAQIASALCGKCTSELSKNKLKKGAKMANIRDDIKEYETPTLTVCPLQAADVITTSGEQPEQPGPDYSGEWDPF